jgi:hypothetical protein
MLKLRAGYPSKKPFRTVFALGNVEHLNNYRRPYTAGLWIGSMSVFKEDYECSVILN